MLNEFVYCPRLFYYEHVEGLFLHNADTIEGKAQHTRLDSGKGALPAARKGKKTSSADDTAEAANSATGEPSATTPPEAAEPETIHARSVSLASDELGVTAKLDLVEGETAPDGTSTFIPVEYKRGAPREGEEGNTLWDADKIQLGLQILLLRENGYTCNQGIIFYRATRQRVTFTLTDDTVVWIRERIAAARIAMAGPIPPPLENSPKCPRCSLAPVCLPDESRLLARMADEDVSQKPLQLELDIIPGDPESLRKITGDTWALVPEVRLPQLKPADNVRRLIAPNDETRALYLNTPGFYVSQKGETLVVKDKDETIDTFRLLDIHHLALFGAVQISTSAIQACCKADIPVSYFSMGGTFYGMTRGNSLPNVLVRIAQFSHASDRVRALFMLGCFCTERFATSAPSSSAIMSRRRAMRSRRSNGWPPRCSPQMMPSPSWASRARPPGFTLKTSPACSAPSARMTAPPTDDLNFSSPSATAARRAIPSTRCCRCFTACSSRTVPWPVTPADSTLTSGSCTSRVMASRRWHWI